MTDRSVSVELRLKAASYLAGLQAAKKATRDLSNETLKATKENHANLQQVGRAGLIAGGTIAAGLGFAVAAATKFDKSLSGVKAVAGATAGQMDDLRQAALDAGRATVFSASESADAEAELAKAGVSVADILGGALRGSLDLAAAGQLGLADAATISAQAMNIFKLRGQDVTHIADVLAAGANKSAADVGQLGDALRQGGLVAAQTGLSLEDTVGALSAFADNALIGSDAGTSLKTMLQRLVPQSEKAQGAMDSIGFSAYDAAGNFVGLESVAGQLHNGLKNLTDQERASTLAIIFGSDAVRAANVLYEEGARGIDDYVSSVNDIGAAQRMAATQLDNLAGDLEQLKGSIETALIQTGSAGNDSLRALTQTATGAVNTFSGLPPVFQQGAFGLGAVSSAALLSVGAIGTLLPKVRATQEALLKLGAAGRFANSSLGLLGKAGLVGVALLSVAFAADKVSQKMREMEGNASPAVDALTASLVKLRESGDLSGVALKTIGADANQLTHDINKSDSGLSQFNSALSKFASFGLGTTGLTESKDRIDALDKSLASLVESGYQNEAADIFLAIVRSGKLSATEIEILRGKLDNYAGAVGSAGAAATLAASASGDLGAGLDDVGMMSEEAATALADLVTALSDAAGAFTDTSSAYTDLLSDKEAAERSSAEATAAATKSGKDSWEDYVNDVSVSIDEYLDKLQEQVTAQRDWETNLLTLSSRVSAGTLQTLAEMGPEGAGLVAEFVDASDRELRRLERLFGKSTDDATSAVAQTLIDAQPILTKIAESQGQKIAAGIARKLAAGKTTVEQIAADYGLAIETYLPDVFKTSVKIVGINEAKSDAEELRQYLADTFFKKITIGGFTFPSATPGRQSGVTTRAAGGIIPGPPSRSDTVPALLSTGEFVVNAASTTANRGLLEAINSGQASRFADGGIVRGAPTYSSSSGDRTGVRIDNLTVVGPDPVATAGQTIRDLRNEAWKAGYSL